MPHKDRQSAPKGIQRKTTNVIEAYALSKTFPGLVPTRLEDGYLELSYDADKIPPKDVLSYVLSHLDVKDIRIDETTLSSIVKKIYATKSL